MQLVGMFGTTALENNLTTPHKAEDTYTPLPSTVILLGGVSPREILILVPKETCTQCSLQLYWKLSLNAKMNYHTAVKMDSSHLHLST